MSKTDYDWNQIEIDDEKRRQEYNDHFRGDEYYKRFNDLVYATGDWVLVRGHRRKGPYIARVLAPVFEFEFTNDSAEINAVVDEGIMYPIRLKEIIRKITEPLELLNIPSNLVSSSQQFIDDAINQLVEYVNNIDLREDYPGVVVGVELLVATGRVYKCVAGDNTYYSAESQKEADEIAQETQEAIDYETRADARADALVEKIRASQLANKTIGG